MLGLAMSRETLDELSDVSVIFHSAASVRFDEILKSAIIMNTRGTHETVKFAMTLKNLASFVHVSTTYCYPELTVVDEKVRSNDKLHSETTWIKRRENNPLNVNFSDLPSSGRMEACY